MNDMWEGFDRTVSLWGEGLARRIDRRAFLRRSLRALGIATAGATVGTFFNPSAALAECSCNGGSQLCGPQFPTGKQGCPTGCTVCRDGDCGACAYISGWWRCCSNCCGTYGHGYKLCYDCKCPNCTNWCVQKSGCLCAQCTSPADVRLDMKADVHA